MQPFMNLEDDQVEFVFKYKELLDESLRGIAEVAFDKNGVLLGRRIADRDVMLFNLGRKYESELHNH